MRNSRHERLVLQSQKDDEGREEGEEEFMRQPVSTEARVGFIPRPDRNHEKKASLQIIRRQAPVHERFSRLATGSGIA